MNCRDQLPAAEPILDEALLQRRKLAFVHVPKTAGTSLTTVLVSGWGRVRIVATNAEVNAMSDADIDDITLLAGHFFPWQIENSRFAEFAPMTILRDPLARLVSAYRFSRERVANGDTVGPAMQFAARVSFGEFVFSSYGCYERHSQVYNLGRNPGEQPQNMPMNVTLKRAKQRLRSMLVGTVDALPEFTQHLFAIFGHPPPPPLPRLNATEDLDDEDLQMSPALRAALMELLEPDYELLAEGRALMQERMARLSPPEAAAPPPPEVAADIAPRHE